MNKFCWWATGTFLVPEPQFLYFSCFCFGDLILVHTEILCPTVTLYKFNEPHQLICKYGFYNCLFIQPPFFWGGGQKSTCRKKFSSNLKNFVNIKFHLFKLLKNCKGLIQYAGKEVGGGSCIGILIRMLHIWEICQCWGWDLAVTDAPLPDVNFYISMDRSVPEANWIFIVAPIHCPWVYLFVTCLWWVMSTSTL